MDGITPNYFILFNLLGFVFGLASIYKNINLKYDKEVFLDISLIIVICGFLGSKMYYFIEYPEEAYLEIFQNLFSFGGSGWYGGFLLVLIALISYCYNKKYNILEMLDNIIIAVPIGIIFGRMGCFLAGDGCYGTETTLPWGMTFPYGTIPTTSFVHPVPLYEVFGNILILLSMAAYRKKVIFSGQFLLLYLFVASILRFNIEFIRLNNIVLLGLTAPQIICLILIVLSSITYYYRTSRRTFEL